MSACRVVVLFGVAACFGRQPARDPAAPPPAPAPPREVVIGRDGVLVDGHAIARLDEIATKRKAIAATVKLAPQVRFELHGEPAAIAVAALRVFAGRAVRFAIGDRPVCAGATVRGQRLPGREEEVRLSVLADDGRFWVGLSLVNEFWELPDRPNERDFEKLEITLKQHKESTFFSDRDDLELGAASGTAADVLTAFELACKVGFRDVAILPKAQLSAVPQL